MNEIKIKTGRGENKKPPIIRRFLNIIKLTEIKTYDSYAIQFQQE